MTTEEEEGQLSPTSASAKDPAVPTESPRPPADRTSALGPPSSTLQPPPGSAWEQECVVTGSPTSKKTKRADVRDPADAAAELPLAKRADVQGPLDSALRPACRTPAAGEEAEDPFGGFFVDQEPPQPGCFLVDEGTLPPSTAEKSTSIAGPLKKGTPSPSRSPSTTAEKSDPGTPSPSRSPTTADKCSSAGQWKKARREKKRKKEEELKITDDGLDQIPESPPEMQLPAWDCLLLDPANDLFSYLETVVHKKPHGGATVRIDFIDLLSWNADLACAVCIGQNKAKRDWLETLVASALENLNQKNGLSINHAKFVNRPDCCYSLKNVLVSNRLFKTIRLFKGTNQVKVKVPTHRGKKLFRAVLMRILYTVAIGDTWDGKLTADDLYYTEHGGGIRIHIVKPANKGGKVEQLVSDVASIWNNIMGPYFDVEGEQLPLYFERLKNDLNDLSTPQNGKMQDNITKQWFFHYLIYHPAFATAAARRLLILDLHTVSKSFRFLDGSCFKKLFGHEVEEWRLDTHVNPILNRTLSYRQNLQEKPMVYQIPHEVIIETKVDDVLKLISYSKPSQVTVHQMAPAVAAAPPVAVGAHEDHVPQEVADEANEAGAGTNEPVGDVGGNQLVGPNDQMTVEFPDQVAPKANQVALGDTGEADKVAPEDDELSVREKDKDEVVVEASQAGAGTNEAVGDVRGNQRVGPNDQMVGGDDDQMAVEDSDQVANRANQVALGDTGEADKVAPEEDELSVGDKDKDEKIDITYDYRLVRAELLRFVKNSISHIPDSSIKLLTLDDPEILNASSFQDLLPDLIQGIVEAIENPEEEEYCKRFIGTWKAYIACVDGQKG